MPLFILFGFWGFYLYGIFNQGATFSVQFDGNNIALMTYNIFALIGNLLPSVYNQLAVFLKIELSLGVMPTDWWSISFPEWAQFPRIPPVIFRFLLRSSVLALYVFVAIAFLSDGIGNIQGLVGALAVSAFSFYLPWVMYWKVFRHEMSLLMKLVCAFWFTLGIGAAVAGTVASMKSMSSMSGGFFDLGEQICSENAFYMGTFAGGGLKNPSRQGAFSHDQGPGSFYDTFYRNACKGDDGPQLLCAQPNVHCCAWNMKENRVICQSNQTAKFYNTSVYTQEALQLQV